MDRRLYEAAVEGSVTSMLNLLHEDALILDRYMACSFTETPLHIAALLGHLEFVKEILRRKPELAGELDSQRSTPLHLASAKGYVEIVKALLLINPEMCSACDRDRRNPLHIAAMKGRVSVLQELVQARPYAARARADQGEPILHLCVQHNQLEALKLLVGSMDDQDSVNSKDNYGNTILHLAVADKQIETINFLLTNTTIEVNAPNACGLTAMDILAHSRRDVKDLDIVECLQQAGALKSRDIHALPLPEFGSVRARSLSSSLHSNHRKAVSSLGSEESSSWEKYFRKQDDWLDKQRDALMVVASLIATMAFQAGVNPPGGVWGDNLIANSPGNSSPVDTPHVAGSSMMGDMSAEQYKKFLAYNTTSFIASLSIILLLISGLPIKRRLFVWILMVIMWVAVSATALAYSVSIITITPLQEIVAASNMGTIAILVWLCLMALLLLGHTIRLMVLLISKIFRRSRGRAPSSSNRVNNTTV